MITTLHSDFKQQVFWLLDEAVVTDMFGADKTTGGELQWVEKALEFLVC